MVTPADPPKGKFGPNGDMQGKDHPWRKVAEFQDGACRHCGGDGSIRKVNPEWLKRRRVNAGVTMRDLAKSIDVSAAYLCDIEHGRRAVQDYIHNAYRKLAADPPKEQR